MEIVHLGNFCEMMSESGEGEKVPRKSDFTIEHILNRAGEKKNDFGVVPSSVVMFPWLQCSRYCPPKVPRKRETPQKRQLGRHPRIPFTSHQLAVLEEKFQQTPYLSSEEVTRISHILQLADVRVKIWFQNRRARERRERTLMEDGAKEKLKNDVDEDNTNNVHSDMITKQTNSRNNVFIPVTSTVFINNTSSLLISQPQFSLQKQ